MILLDKPYVSKFLIETLKENKFEVIATSEAKNLLTENGFNWISETDAVNKLNENPLHPLYTNSENAISWVEKHLNQSRFSQNIAIFKNKIKFREMLKPLFPDYFFKSVLFSDLNTINAAELPFPVILKPAIGFFSLGVHKIDTESEWFEAVDKINNDIESIKGFYPIEVVDTEYFIIEKCIEGEEYAVDCYFNLNGEAVVINCMHHIFSSGKDVSDRVYVTSKKIIETHLNNLQNFLTKMGNLIHLKQFPIHIEVRIDSEGKIIPIEVNPMRFGGWCTTGDVAWYAYGINSYKHFIEGKKPDWKNILSKKGTEIYSLILLDNTTGYKPSEIDYFDYEKVINDFEKILLLRKIDYSHFPIFGFIFAETSAENTNELQHILTSNLKKYVKLKNQN
jgi:hypothetical protein